jgi:hypothetical protein
MPQLHGELQAIKTLKDVKAILSTVGPCLSIYMPLTAPRQNEVRWRDGIRNLETRTENVTHRELIRSVANWSSLAPEEPVGDGAIAVLRSRDVFATAVLGEKVSERTVLAPHFYIRPLLPELTKDTEFYLLALSQKHTRLLHCTQQTMEEVELPPDVKTDYEEWLNLAKPDHRLIYNSSAGADSGTAKGVVTSWGAENEAKTEYLAHYFKQIDHGVHAILRCKTEPLILCAVDYELPIYRKENTYPHLANEAVLAAPNSLKFAELQSRALEASTRCNATKIDEALAEWDHKVGSGASSHLAEVVAAARDGRVLTLVVSDSLEHTGGRAGEDPVNDAAIQTILRAGRVLVAPHSKMPNGAAAAAIFRF